MYLSVFEVRFNEVCQIIFINFFSTKKPSWNWGIFVEKPDAYSWFVASSILSLCGK
jgi:hypothetical protein